MSKAKRPPSNNWSPSSLSASMSCFSSGCVSIIVDDGRRKRVRCCQPPHLKVSSHGGDLLVGLEGRCFVSGQSFQTAQTGTTVSFHRLRGEFNVASVDEEPRREEEDFLPGGSGTVAPTPQKPGSSRKRMRKICFKWNFAPSEGAKCERTKEGPQFPTLHHWACLLCGISLCS